MTKLMESSIPASVSQILKGQNLNLEPVHIGKVYTAIVLAIGELIKIKKSKEKGFAVVVTDMKDNLLLAAYAKYEKKDDEKEDEMNPSSWNIGFTFDREDIKDFTLLSSKDPEFMRVIDYFNIKNFRFSFNDSVACYITVEACCNGIKGWLDVNAKDGEKVEVEHEDSFIASVEVKDGEKVFNIEMDEKIKAVIKDKNDDKVQAE